MRVAVNVSAEQLGDPSFVTAVTSALAHAELSAHRLELEVTESVFMREGTGAEQLLDRILALGVKLSLDDFGTGYSSLGYLRKTRFSTIKRSEEHTSELPSLMRISYAVFCLKKKTE